MSARQGRVVHKRTPASSWKENLRQSCLQRAKNRRGGHGDANTMSLLVRNLVQEEMKQQHVVLKSPCIERTSRHDERGEFFPVNEEYHSMTEEEWIELLREVEEEMERNQLEEALDLQVQENLHLRDQIEDFERWESAHAHGDSHEQELQTVVLCPICNEANLCTTQDGAILCPNQMDGSCSLYFNFLPGLNLDALKDALQLACEEHGTYCNNSLSFRLATDSETSADLSAVCGACGLEQTLLST